MPWVYLGRDIRKMTGVIPWCVSQAWSLVKTLGFTEHHISESLGGRVLQEGGDQVSRRVCSEWLDTGTIRYQDYQIPRLSDTGTIRYRDRETRRSTGLRSTGLRSMGLRSTSTTRRRRPSVKKSLLRVAGEEVCRFPRPVRSIWTVLRIWLESRSSRLWSRQVKFGLCGFLETMPRWVGIMRKRWSWSISRRGREDDPSQSRERLALWQKKELEGLAWEKNPPLMESIVRNLVSLPMSGRMPRNMSALAPCWDGACGLPPRVQPWRGEGAPLIPKDVGVKGPMALKMVVENVRGEQIHI